MRSFIIYSPVTTYISRRAASSTLFEWFASTDTGYACFACVMDHFRGLSACPYCGETTEPTTTFLWDPITRSAKPVELRPSQRLSLTLFVVFIVETWHKSMQFERGSEG